MNLTQFIAEFRLHNIFVNFICLLSFEERAIQIISQYFHVL